MRGGEGLLWEPPLPAPPRVRCLLAQRRLPTREWALGWEEARRPASPSFLFLFQSLQVRIRRKWPRALMHIYFQKHLSIKNKSSWLGYAGTLGQCTHRTFLGFESQVLTDPSGTAVPRSWWTAEAGKCFKGDRSLTGRTLSPQLTHTHTPVHTYTRTHMLTHTAHVHTHAHAYTHKD